jgi:hypothetical protein
MDGHVPIRNADGEPIAWITGDGQEAAIAAALVGVLNSAEAGQPLSVTLANLAAGRAA